MKIYIDAGHGGSDPGAVSGSVRESELNLKAALACRDYLSAYDCQVIMSRETDIAVPVQNRYKQAIAEMVDAVLCIHHNAGGGDGGEVWFWHTDNRAKELARLTAIEYKAIGQNLRTGAGMPEGVKASKPDTRQNFGMCREPSAKGIPAILGEFAFVDNVTDRQIVDTDAELAEQGKAYGRAVVKFLGLKLKTGAPAVVTPPIVTPTLKSIEEIAREVINGKWGNGQDRVDRLNAAGYDALTVQAVVNKMITGNKPTTTPPIVPSVPKAGDVFNLYRKPLFISATSKVAIRKITGTYYLYDGQKINGRYRITNSPKNVSKKPARWYVTGWVAM
jgi:N-acetylmuramoyl-L-alanine amidase